VQAKKKWDEKKSSTLARPAMTYEVSHVYAALTVLDTFRTYRFRK
jgi:hypothetical protein